MSTVYKATTVSCENGRQLLTEKHLVLV